MTDDETTERPQWMKQTEWYEGEQCQATDENHGSLTACLVWHHAS